MGKSEAWRHANPFGSCRAVGLERVVISALRHEWRLERDDTCTIGDGVNMKKE